jgi:hypothetical protein
LRAPMRASRIINTVLGESFQFRARNNGQTVIIA